MLNKSISDEELIESARKARENSSAAFSGFHVGAAILTKTGKVYTGCNIENYSLSLSICAERVALFKALSEGEKDFIKIAIVSNDSEFCYPCGSCRQALYEFASDIKVLVNDSNGSIKAMEIAALLPLPFKH